MPTLVRFRLKNPFESVCETCKEKKTCRSIQFKTETKGNIIRQYGPQEHIACKDCLKMMDRRSYRYTPCTPEELEEKIRQQEEDTRVGLKDMPKKKQLPRRCYASIRRPIHVSRTESY